jgi:hypothetical protein
MQARTALVLPRARRRPAQSRSIARAADRGKFSRIWLTRFAERGLAAPSRRNPCRYIRVSCHLDQSSRRSVARSRAGPVVGMERRRACRLGCTCNRSHFSRIVCHNCGSTRRSQVGGYYEQSCYRPLAGTQPLDTDRSRCPRAARFVGGHRTCASWLLRRFRLRVPSLFLSLRQLTLPLRPRVLRMRLLATMPFQLATKPRLRASLPRTTICRAALRLASSPLPPSLRL